MLFLYMMMICDQNPYGYGFTSKNKVVGFNITEKELVLSCFCITFERIHSLVSKFQNVQHTYISPDVTRRQ